MRIKLGIITVFFFIMNFSNVVFADDQADRIQQLEEKIKTLEGVKFNSRIIPAGTVEIGFSLGGITELTPSIGYFLSDNLEISAEYGQVDMEIESGDTVNIEQNNIALSFAYHFPISKVFMPFISIGMEKGRVKEIDEETSLDAFFIKFGGKYFISDNSSVNLYYGITDGSIEIDSAEFDTLQKEITFAYSLYIK